MNGNQTGNGNNGMNKFFGWIMGALVAPAVLAGSASLTHMVISDSARLTALERDTENRLRQIERKLDRILERP
jgi:hypothetical protein